MQNNEGAFWNDLIILLWMSLQIYFLSMNYHAVKDRITDQNKNKNKHFKRFCHKTIFATFYLTL